MDAGLGLIIFMGVVLKLPIAFACYILWRAIKDVPSPEEAAEDGGDHRFRRFRREPKPPIGPRRGPHAPDALPLPCPEGGQIRVTLNPARRRVAPAGRHERSRP